MSKNLYVPVLQKKGRQKKSRPDGRLEQSLKIWWRLLELGRNGVEACVDRTDDHNRNAGGKQAILNRGGA